MDLTKQQQDIVDLEKGQHLILAPPGTGKTELLVQRLSKAIQNGIAQDTMICLTFTNRAAKNMLDRVAKEVGTHHVFIGNIHSFCNTFLRKHNIIANNTSLLDEEDVELLLKEVIMEYPCYIDGRRGRDTIKSIQLYRYNIFRKKQQLQFPKELIDKLDFLFVDGTEGLDTANKLCDTYERIKEESSFIDFDDLLLLTYHYLINHPTSIPIIKWLQIDEVQDLNPLQWAIINKISNRESSHRVFFGDYEQAIFSFMGAKLEVLDKVATVSKIHFLQNNFRSPQYLLKLYNTYAKAWLAPKWQSEPVSKNPLVMTSNALSFKEVITQHENGRYSTIEDEINWIVRNKLPREPQENTAILVSTNTMADAFAYKFDEAGVDYFKISGFDLFHRNEIKDLMAFLSIIVNKEDRNAWIRNFHLYGRIRTLKDARIFINYLFSIGLRPFDFIGEQRYKQSYLDDFLFLLREQRIIVFDTETTGLDTQDDDIIQIAAIEIINGKIGQSFEVFINTDKDLLESEKIHHITKDYLDEHAISKTEALSKFINFIDSDTLIAHNLQYDYEILNNNLQKEGLSKLSETIKLYDSIDLSKRLYPKLPSYKLEYLLEELGIEGINSHNALDDVKATVNLILTFEHNILRYAEKRKNFMERYNTVFKNMKERFFPIYNAVSGHFTEEMPLKEVVSMIMGYMTDTLKYKTNETIYAELDKLLKHMDHTCVLENVFDSINKHIPEYIKYKESDLVIGNEKIIIATIHKAKGLEFENVIIPACTDDNFPSYYSKLAGEEGILESARLLYVGITRARKRLLITSHTKHITNWGKEFSQQPSRFLVPIKYMLE